ncbi:MAG: T9SS type A sorting domain-containing protein [Sphingobacteriales bacterium]|nr:MAG: T9SS type A sorting domain-containing protein [Sphingobacteriales bacterium]
MSKLFLLSMICGITLNAHAQHPKNYRLTLVAEGNFGTPNGDIYTSSSINGNTSVVQALYQSANSTTGIDVLQDFDFNGDKAILCGKGTQPLKLAVVNYPGMDTVFTVSSGLGAGIQRCGMVSPHKAYIFAASGGAIRLVDIDNQTVSPVSDPNSYFANGVHSMVAYNNAMYVAYPAKVVKIDTLTQTAISAIAPGITAINTMVKDTANNALWLLGKSGTTNAVVKIDMNNDAVSAPILLPGFTNAKLLRVGPGKLYFVSGINFHVYDINTATVAATPIHTSVLPGSSFALMYDRSFTVDPVSGDFAYASAGAFTAPGHYCIVDGTDSSIIISSDFENASIPNELFLETWAVPWDTLPLPQLFAACSINLSAPTALYNTQLITGTTDSMSFNSQGNHIITWQYVSGNDTITQLQLLTISDTTAPQPDQAQLAVLTVPCPYTLTAPTATDNCAGTITGTTDAMTFTIAGNYTITWTYTDSAGNSSTQEQSLTLDCTGTGLQDPQQLQAKVYPNPADAQLTVALPVKDNYQFNLVNTLGQVQHLTAGNGDEFTLDTRSLPAGIYLLNIINSKGVPSYQKVMIRH